MYGKPLKLDWVARVVFRIQIPLTFSDHCNRYVDIYGWRLTGYENLICSFSSCWQTFPKANYFRVYKKLITWPIIAKKKKRKKGGGGWKVWVELCLWGLKTLTFATQPHPQDAFPWLLLPCLRQETIFHDPYSFHFE